jgi:type IV pilus assembly protein PilQ
MLRMSEAFGRPDEADEVCFMRLQTLEMRMWMALGCVLAGAASAADPQAMPAVYAASTQPAASEPAPVVYATSTQRAPGEPACGMEEQAVTRNQNGKIDLHVRNLDVTSALIQLRRLERRNIVISPGVNGTVSLDLYGVSFEEALNAILRSANLVMRQEGAFTYVCTAMEAPDRFGTRRNLTTQMFRLGYVGADEATKLIQPLLSREGKVSATSVSQKGIPTNKESAGGNDLAAPDTLVVVDYPENIERIQTVIAGIDVRPRQVLIEATILAAALQDDNSMGVDFVSLCGVDFTGLGATSVGGTNVSLGNLPAGQFDRSTTNVSTQFLDGMPKGGLKIGWLNNGIGVFVQALEQVTDTVVLANPKVLVLNKQRGEVMVGRRDGYRTTITTETTTIENVQFLETGTRLIFRPFIGSDNYIRLEIHPEDSTGGLTDTGLPYEETAEVTTNIVVKDGTTAVIGGLFRDNTKVMRGQVPLLGELPGVGAAFRRTRDQTLKQEVIILLTPHIVDDPAHDDNSRQLLEDAEKIRVGLRQGLQWHGREWLSQAYYRAATTHLQQGHRTLALWEVNAAIGLQPTFLDAIHLRERILAKEFAEPSGSAIKDLVLKHIEGQRQPAEYEGN